MILFRVVFGATRKDAEAPSCQGDFATPAQADIVGENGPRLSPIWRRCLVPWCLGGLIFFLSIASPAFAAGIAGYWYGEGYQPLWHRDAQWLMHLAPDGRYSVEFREYRHCRLVRDQKETGSWRMGASFRTVTTGINGAPTRYENDYRILSVTASEFRILQTRTGQEYTERRVAPDFAMPDPACATS
jgi:hypothetical protein